MTITKDDAFRRKEQYRKAQPKQFGDLHERMKLVIALMQAAKASVPDELWHAIYDLETEVSFYEPAKPPYGRRVIRCGR
jgi:hypothetical protein